MAAEEISFLAGPNNYVADPFVYYSWPTISVAVGIRTCELWVSAL